MRPAATAATSLLVLALSGCGGDEEKASPKTSERPAAPATPSARAAPVDVSLTEYELRPENPRIKRGIVEFSARNGGRVVHALEVEAPTGEVETPEIQPGDSATLRADLRRPGTYVWYCPVGNHEELGMKGRITVTGGGSTGGAGGGSGGAGGGSGGGGSDGGSGY